MKKEQFLRIGLTKDMAQKVMELIKQEQRSFIPKQRFDQVNDMKKELEKQIMRQNAQIANMNHIKLKNQELEQIAKEFWLSNKSARAEQEAKLKEFFIQSALRKKLLFVKYPDFFISKINKEKLTLTPEGTVLGIEEQLLELKELYKDLL